MSDRITFAAEVSAEGRRLKGTVKLAGSRTFRNGEWVEVDPRALMKADASNVFATIDHDTTRVVGRTTNGTLQVNRTEDGLEFSTEELPNTSYANDALELAGKGYFGGSSFSIEGHRSKFSVNPEDGLRVRTINSIKRLVDVAIVMDPAFSTSSAAAFSKETNVAQNTVVLADDDEEEQEEPKAPPAKKATFTQQTSGKEQWAAVAKTASLEQITGTMDALFAKANGDLSGDQLDQYEAFADELESRKKADSEARIRKERIEARHNFAMGRIPKAPEQSELFASDDYKEAFSKYLRGNVAVMEQFAQSIAGDGTQGGYAVPESFRNKIVLTQAAFGGIQQHADLIETGDGRALPWPTNDDTANSAAVASEGSAPGSGGADLVLGEISLGAFSIAATGTGNAPLKVSWELLQDSMLDFEAMIAERLGTRLGRKAAALYANGVGTTEPFGLFSKTPDSMTATSMYAALVEHMFQVDQAYRDSGNCRWIMSDATFAKVFNSVDLNNRPLFQPSAQAGGQAGPSGSLLGYPVQLDQASGDNVAFGDIRQGFIIRRVRDIQVVVDPYNNTATRQNAYHAWMRTDSAIQDSAAVSVSDYGSVTADAVGS